MKDEKNLKNQAAEVKEEKTKKEVSEKELENVAGGRGIIIKRSR